MEVGTEIPWFYQMFVSSVKVYVIIRVVMIIVPSFSECCNRYVPLWFHVKNMFLMFQNDEVEL